MGKREQKARRMAELIERWQASGLSARKFAAESRIPEARLWYWKGRVRPRAAAPAFIPLQLVSQEAPARLPCFELTLGDGRKLVIPAALTGRALRQLLASLRSC